MRVPIALYRNLLRLHRILPAEERSLGNAYVRDEFQRHKGLQDKKLVETFLSQWSDYYGILSSQTQAEQRLFGRKLSGTELDSLSEEQVGQLHSLFEELRRSNR